MTWIRNDRLPFIGCFLETRETRVKTRVLKKNVQWVPKMFDTQLMFSALFFRLSEKDHIEFNVTVILH